jgi:hypothetical protein
MSDADRKFYKENIPLYSDTSNVAKEKVKILLRLVNDRKKAISELAKSGGYINPIKSKPTQSAPRSQTGQGGASVGGIPQRHQGKINFKDTVTGEMYSADTEEEFNQMNNQGSAKQGGQPRFVRIN